MQFLLIFLTLLLVSSAPAKELPTLSYEEIVQLKKPMGAWISQDGNWIAYTVVQGDLAQNKNRVSLYLVDKKGIHRKKIYEADRISEIKWTSLGTLLFLAKEGNSYTILSNGPERINPLYRTEDLILRFTLSTDCSMLYFNRIKQTSSEIIKRYQEEGYVYNWDVDISLDIHNGYKPHNEFDEVLSYDFDSRKIELILQLPIDSLLAHNFEGVIESMALSVDQKYLLLDVHSLGKPELGGFTFSNAVYMWDLLNQREETVLKTPLEAFSLPKWLDDRQFVYYKESRTSGSSLHIYHLDTQEEEKMDWATLPNLQELVWNPAQNILFAISKTKIQKLSPTHRTVEEHVLPIFTVDNASSIDQTGDIFASILEDSMTSPEVVLYDLKSQKTKRLTHLNPLLSKRFLGRVEKIEVTTSSGSTTTGYLIHPRNEIPSHRYPLIIATYGFRGSFIADAEWHSTFPAQTLAGEGYLVLLLNCGHSAQGLVGDPMKAQKIEGWDELERFEKAVDQLVERELVDPTRVGLYGWSHGAFLVNFIIANSKKFHAACLGEGGDYNPGMYWLLGGLFSHYDNILGGPPWGDTLKYYLEFSPFYRVEQIQTPLLMEFAAESCLGALEMYSPLRHLKVPAELIVYQGEEHNFVQPRARVASMARKVDWFNFWLLNKLDPSETKREQYSRWQKMAQEAHQLAS